LANNRRGSMYQLMRFATSSNDELTSASLR
jgi:hypothetical protein